MLAENCNWFHLVDWDEDTNEIIHAVCTLPSKCWPNCDRCLHKAEYADIDPCDGDCVGCVRFYKDASGMGRCKELDIN